MMDLTELIVAEHDRIGRLFGALEDVTRYASHQAGRRGPRMLEEAWARLSGLITAHTAAEQQVFYPALPAARGGGDDGALAEHLGILSAVREVGLHEPGSPAWRRAVADLRAGTCAHFGAEERVLVVFRQCTEPRLRDALGRQWAAL